MHSHSYSAIRAVATTVTNAIEQRFKIYYTIVDGDVPLPLRVACVHPQHGHLSHLNIEQRDKVWNAVLADTEFVVTRNSDV